MGFLSRLDPLVQKDGSYLQARMFGLRWSFTAGRRGASGWGFSRVIGRLLTGARASQLATEYPNVTVEPDAIHVHDRRVRTSAGRTSCIDLALALIEQDTRRRVALKVAQFRVAEDLDDIVNRRDMEHRRQPGSDQHCERQPARIHKLQLNAGRRVHLCKHTSNPRPPPSTISTVDRSSMTTRTRDKLVTAPFRKWSASPRTSLPPHFSTARSLVCSILMCNDIQSPSRFRLAFLSGRGGSSPLHFLDE